MNRFAIGATLLGSILSTPAFAQEPVSGARFHLQLLSADTGIVTVQRDPRVLRTRAGSMAIFQCARADSGADKRGSRECGPTVRRSAQRLLVDTTITADAQGHVRERLTWSGGEAAVELDASDRPGMSSREQMRLQIGFWPRLAHGAPARPADALRMTHAAATYGKLIAMTVNYKDGAQILLVLPER